MKTLQVELDSSRVALTTAEEQRMCELAKMKEEMKEEIEIERQRNAALVIELEQHSAASTVPTIEAEAAVVALKQEVIAVQQHAAEEKEKKEKAEEDKEMVEKQVVALESSLTVLQVQLESAQQTITEYTTQLSLLKEERVAELQVRDLEFTAAISERMEINTVAVNKLESDIAIQITLRSDLEIALNKSKENAQNLMDKLGVAENNLKVYKEGSIQKISDFSVEIQKLESSVASKKSDLDATRANLAATTTAYSALSAQHNQLKLKADQLTQQLEAEINQTQDRKAKVRAYVDNLNAEKREMELVRQGLSEELLVSGSKISTLESQIEAEEMKLKREEIRFNSARQMAIVELEQQQQEFNLKLEAQENQFNMQVVETQRLQGLLDEHARATAEEVQQQQHRNNNILLLINIILILRIMIYI